jgi:hypothetical protein
MEIIMENRPRGREKHVTGKGKDIYKRGDGLHSGPVGSQNGYSGRGQQSGSGRRAVTRAGGGGLIIIVIIAAIILLSGKGSGLSGCMGGGTDTSTQYTQSSGTSSSGSSIGSSSLSSLFGGYGNVSSGWSQEANVGKLNTTVAEGARAKRTNILGNGNDTVTLMVYMCGTDLESKYGMGTSDLSEMAAATLSDKVNIIVYTGGCKQWKTSAISNSYNQIYKIESGGMRLLVQNAGTDSMVKPSTLTGFIQYCTQNYPANRNMLIFWDHGGGSLSGYGYDEKNPTAGSMTLQGINQALKNAGTTFDFIGFDACLMATLENALMLTDYSDYLIASEETEPGVGWYYTNWLSRLSENTSMSTLEIGKNIVDDFVAVCNQKCAGQQTTLSVVDLAELETTVPAKFKDFAVGTSQLIQGSEYSTVSSARSSTREFASSNKIDQVDLIHLAYNIGTDESKALAKTLLDAVKYNKTSSSITDAYGLSIYFPYQRTSKVDSAVAAYNAIGIDSEYARCIQQFASMEVSGQAVSGGVSNPLGSLLGGSSSGSTAMDPDMISQMLGGLLGGGGSLSSLTGGSSGFFGRSIDVDSATEFISDNQFDAGQLVWLENGASYELTLSEDQWKLVNDIELNVFYDDGEGYIDLGLDNVFNFTDDGALVGEFDGTWLAIDDQPVPYYHISTVDDGDSYTITGRVPVMYNGDRADLILVFDNENPYGYIAGVRYDYDESETEVIAKGITELTAGDEIDFICDYYSYDGTYQDSYYFGDTYVYDGSAEISNVYIDASRANATYRFTDIYCQQYWTPAIP